MPTDELFGNDTADWADVVPPIPKLWAGSPSHGVT